MASLLKAQALRAKYLTRSSYTSAVQSGLTAVVVGSTSGIGEACSHRLAEQGYNVIAVGRHRPGRAESIIQKLNEKSKTAHSSLFDASSSNEYPKHEFYPCDAFSLVDVHSTANKIKSKHSSIDVLVLTQGMATTQGFTPTSEGNDEKLTLHYYSRIAMTVGLLSTLKKSQKKKGAIVLSVLSGGVHKPYEKFQEDIDLKQNYSVVNAADAAGYYTDLGFDHLALKEKDISFVHAAPGFVNTNWGTEFNWFIRSMVRCLQLLGKKASDCAEYMLSPTVFASDEDDVLLQRPNGRSEGIYIMGETGQSHGLTKNHTEEARDFVWNHTVQVLKKAGVHDIE